MWYFCIGTSRSCPVNTLYFIFGFLKVSLQKNILYVFLDPVDLTSVRGFDFNFYFIIFFETPGLVFIFVSVVSLTFNKLTFVLTFGVTPEFLEPNLLYSKLTKNTTIVIILPAVFDH